MGHRKKTSFNCNNCNNKLQLHNCNLLDNDVKGALSVLRQFLANESPLKMIKNTFYFTLKALSVLKIFKLLS